MRVHTFSAPGHAHAAQAWQLFATIIILESAFVSHGFAQSYAAAPKFHSASFAGAQFEMTLPLAALENTEDDFQTDVASLEGASSQNMVGQPATALPCAEHARSNETNADVAVATTNSSSDSGGASDAQADRFLVDKIQSVQRMVQLMRLKEEILLEKARFEQKLLDMQRQIDNQ